MNYAKFCPNYGVVPTFSKIMEVFFNSTKIMKVLFNFAKIMVLWFSFAKVMELCQYLLELWSPP
jgi:hypothetical protein